MQEVNEVDKSFLIEENKNLCLKLEKLNKDHEKLKKTHQALEHAFNDLAFKLLQKEIKESILKHNPIDFDDVWVAVLDRLKTGDDLKKDFDSIVKDIKKYNPSLFFEFPV